MADDTTKNGKNESQAFAKTAPVTQVPKSGASSKPAARATTPVDAKGQKYVSPEGRHSQQTHRRAEERAAADGHTTEKEQHAHDREAVETELNRASQQKENQRQQSARGATPKA